MLRRDEKNLFFFRGMRWSPSDNYAKRNAAFRVNLDVIFQFYWIPVIVHSGLCLRNTRLNVFRLFMAVKWPCFNQLTCVYLCLFTESDSEESNRTDRHCPQKVETIIGDRKGKSGNPGNFWILSNSWALGCHIMHNSSSMILFVLQKPRYFAISAIKTQ